MPNITDERRELESSERVWRTVFACRNVVVHKRLICLTDIRRLQPAHRWQRPVSVLTFLAEKFPSGVLGSPPGVATLSYARASESKHKAQALCSLSCRCFKPFLFFEETLVAAARRNPRLYAA